MTHSNVSQAFDPYDARANRYARRLRMLAREAAQQDAQDAEAKSNATDALMRAYR